MELDVIVIIVFVILLVISSFCFSKINKKNKINKQKEYDKLYPIYSNPNTVKVAVWISVSTINGNPVDLSRVYNVQVKSAMSGANMDVDVFLLEPGVYDFVVNSRRYTNAPIQAELKAGQTYQLGANDDGPYIIVDQEPERYQLNKVD